MRVSEESRKSIAQVCIDLKTLMSDVRDMRDQVAGITGGKGMARKMDTAIKYLEACCNSDSGPVKADSSLDHSPVDTTPAPTP